MRPACREYQPCPFCRRSLAIPYGEDEIAAVGECPFCNRINTWYRPIDCEAVSGVILNPEKLPARNSQKTTVIYHDRFTAVLYADDPPCAP